MAAVSGAAPRSSVRSGGGETSIHQGSRQGSRSRWRSVAPFLLLAAFAGVLPLLVDGAGLFLWEMIAVQAVFALGTNLLVGHANIHTFGQAAFFGAGGYAVALMSIRGWPVVLTLVMAIGLCALLGALIGGISARATAMGTLMITVAVAQSLHMLTGRLSVFGGDNGLSAIAEGLPSTIGTGYWYLIASLSLVAVAVLWCILHSPFGALLHAMRDDPLKVAHLGINVKLVRVAVFTLSGAFCGFAGSLAAFTQSAVSPEFFLWVVSGNALIMCVLGGMRSFWGPAAGAVLYMLLTHELQGALPTISILVTGVALLVVVLLLPGGLADAPGRLKSSARLVTRRVWA